MVLGPEETDIDNVEARTGCWLGIALRGGSVQMVGVRHAANKEPYYKQGKEPLLENKPQQVWGQITTLSTRSIED